MFVPSHITGFFSIVDNDNSLKKGSIGAGILIDKGVKTIISTNKNIISIFDPKEDNKNISIANNTNANNITTNNTNTNTNNRDSDINVEVDITVNNSKTHPHNYIIIKTIEKVFNNINNFNNNITFNLNTFNNIDKNNENNNNKNNNNRNKNNNNNHHTNNYNITINQEIQVPIGCGFGSSAASALGVAIGISKLFNINKITASQIAHKIEVELGTGLGDVIAETSKGLVLRTAPGAPGIGEAKSVSDELINKNIHSIYFVSKSIGEIETKSIIETNSQKEIINKIGEKYYNEFKSNPNLANFFRCSRKFCQETNLINSYNLVNIIAELDNDELGFQASMAMLGKTGFTITKNPEKYDDSYLKAKIDLNGIDIKIEY